MNKTIRYIAVFLFLGFSCSKKETPAPTVGCAVTFNGKAVKMADLVCDTTSLVSTNLPQEQILTLFKTDTLTSISFVVSGDPDSYFSSTFAPSPPTVTISGKTWTFNGPLVNNLGTSASISGVCTCSN